MTTVEALVIGVVVLAYFFVGMAFVAAVFR